MDNFLQNKLDLEVLYESEDNEDSDDPDNEEGISKEDYSIEDNGMTDEDDREDRGKIAVILMRATALKNTM